MGHLLLLLLLHLLIIRGVDWFGAINKVEDVKVWTIAKRIGKSSFFFGYKIWLSIVGHPYKQIILIFHEESLVWSDCKNCRANSESTSRRHTHINNVAMVEEKTRAQLNHSAAFEGESSFKLLNWKGAIN
jgi:hypothetical protein